MNICSIDFHGEVSNLWVLSMCKLQGPVVQSIVSLTTSLRHEFVKYMSTTKANTVLFFVEKM